MLLLHPIPVRIKLDTSKMCFLRKLFISSLSCYPKEKPNNLNDFYFWWTTFFGPLFKNLYWFRFLSWRPCLSHIWRLFFNQNKGLHVFWSQQFFLSEVFKDQNHIFSTMKKNGQRMKIFLKISNRITFSTFESYFYDVLWPANVSAAAAGFFWTPYQGKIDESTFFYG